MNLKEQIFWQANAKWQLQYVFVPISNIVRTFTLIPELAFGQHTTNNYYYHQDKTYIKYIIEYTLLVKLKNYPVHRYPK